MPDTRLDAWLMRLTTLSKTSTRDGSPSGRFVIDWLDLQAVIAEALRDALGDSRPRFPVTQRERDIYERDFGDSRPEAEYRPTHIRGERQPIDLDEIEMRWASQWNESDDGEVRAWRSDVAALIDEVRRLRADFRLDAAWAQVDATLRTQGSYNGFSVAADGPGYVARSGELAEWSVDDPELVGNPDTPASPAKALLKLDARLAADG